MSIDEIPVFRPQWRFPGGEHPNLQLAEIHELQPGVY
jgi:hypothetical protein